MSNLIKLSSPATQEFWKIPVLFEDEHLLALDKPSRLLTSPDRDNRERPNLMKLLHRDIERGAPWSTKRGLTYLMHAHRLDFETSGIVLLAKTKPVLVDLANLFGAEKPDQLYVGLAQGQAQLESFEVNAKLAPHPVKIGSMRVDEKDGKRSRTLFEVRERFAGYTLLECRPRTARTHQIRVHLWCQRLPLAGDELYGGRPLLLSTLKPEYRLKPHKKERPLIDRVALHATQLSLDHPVTGARITVESPWPKDLIVAVKYLRRYASGDR